MDVNIASTYNNQFTHTHTFRKIHLEPRERVTLSCVKYTGTKSFIKKFLVLLKMLIGWFKQAMFKLARQ